MPAKTSENFEASLERLNEILSLLDRGGSTLDESIKLFEEGAKLAVHCENLLQKAEQKVLTLDDCESEEQIEGR